MSENPAERASMYIAKLEVALHGSNALEQDTAVKSPNISKVLDAIHRYQQDARFYLKNDKPVTALASISYAEGLLDALNFLELAKPKTTQ